MPEQFTAPKKRFLKSELAKWYADISDSAQFKQVVDVALLEFMFEASGSRDGNSAAATAFRLEGAKRFASILLNLCERELSPKPPETDNLKET